MKVLVVGSGGREHALAWKLALSPKVSEVIVAPGNGGTNGGKLRSVSVAATDIDGLLALATEEGVRLTFVGPEAPLADGIVDRFEAVGQRIFGPTQAAAQLESSKAFAKDFMIRHGIPTAAYRTFTDYESASAWLDECGFEVVVKASGLAAGKGAIVCANHEKARAALREILLEKRFGDAGTEVVIEEQLTGQEASIIALCDGESVKIFPAAQDHKRAYEGDKGPNTGGMGAYVPAPVVTPEVAEFAAKHVIQATVDGMAKDGVPFKGVMFVGLMFPPSGPKVLEYNCRFGDPETEVLLPMLESDLFDLFDACIDGKLAEVDMVCRSGAAATVVMASGGYPGSYTKGYAISGIESVEDAMVFQAGTKLVDGQTVTNGGRVLTVTGVGSDLRSALDKAYAGVDAISFQDAMVRRDIGHRAL